MPLLNPTVAPPRPPPGRLAVVTDLDRTFTRMDLAIDPEAVQRARALRRAGITMVLATGRPLTEIPLSNLHGAFDWMVIEGGATWGRPGRWTTTSIPPEFWNSADSLLDEGIDVRQGAASYSIPAEAEGQLAGTAGLAMHRNCERIDVTPAGVDKASGLHQVLGTGHEQPWLLAAGDGENDLPLLRIANVGVAVENASPALKAAAHLVAPHRASRGFLWAVRDLDKEVSAPESLLDAAALRARGGS